MTILHNYTESPAKRQAQRQAADNKMSTLATHFVFVTQFTQRAVKRLIVVLLYSDSIYMIQPVVKPPVVKPV